MRYTVVLVFFLFSIFCGTKNIVTPLAPGDEFERALSYFENKRYDQAISSFERIILYHPSSEYVDDAQFWLGCSYFEKKDYEQAIVEFDYLINNFPNTSFLEQALLFRAKAYFLKAPNYDKDISEVKRAIEQFDEFIRQFPNSKYIEEVRGLILKARTRLARKEFENGRLYIKLGKPKSALLYFNYVIKNYPETEVSNEAKFEAAKLYQKMDDKENALRLYQELLENDIWKERAAKRIETLKQKDE
ncbi:hypothetical protein BXT86_06605 [candidate division WOR-3 bacterium 4484_100]|uniref:Outer membrane lipoprotein BamD-like domain-containing protein n=1 Tax=candidate division WOR-3 bacterium 4484_100 TaxID=1936077 RepID=A0A1V4QDI6_UNCW3|nr:MAG: hypothetical protein BXT86_06605 [candidate division WOR-3 bacterium 4484_100]